MGDVESLHFADLKQEKNAKAFFDPGRIAMPRHYLYRGHIQVQIIWHYRNRGMPERRGRRLAGAPKSGNVIFVSGLSNF
jgi:hypothetical protein